MRKRFFLGLIWLSSILLTVWMTRSKAPAVLPPEVVVKTIEVPGPVVEIWPEELDLVVRESVAQAPSWRHDDEEDAAALDEPQRAISGAEFRETLGMALLSRDLVGRNLVIAHLLANLSHDNVNAALSAFENAPRNGFNDQHFKLFVHAWAQLDGEAAMGYLATQHSTRKVAGSDTTAMAAWSATNPNAALDYVENQAPKRAGALYAGLVRGWAKTDLDGATRHVEQLDNPERRRNMVGVLARGLMEDHGGRAALQWVDQATRDFGQSDPAYSDTVFDQVFKAVRPDQAAEAANWLDRNPDHPRVEDWVYQKVSRDYVRGDPQGAVQWVESYRLAGSERFNFGVIGNFAGAWANDDPYTAMEWADNMDSPARRSSAYSQIANRWNEHDLENAEAWLEAGREDPLMDDARRRYSMRIADNDPIRALEYGTQIKNPSYREESLVNAAQVLFGRNPDAVYAWLPVSGLGQDAQARIIDKASRQ